MERFFTGLVALALGITFVTNSSARDFTFRERGLHTFQVAETNAISKSHSIRSKCATNDFEITSRVTVQLDDPKKINALIADKSLKLSRKVNDNTFILQAPDALTAAQEAAHLSILAGVQTSIPVLRRPAKLYATYAPKPNDPYSFNQWHLEARDPQTGAHIGADMNARAAWPFTLGQGVTVAVADDGIELTHPDLAARVAGAPHYNFYTNSSDGSPDSNADMHATAVAGLIAEEMNNNLGGTGIAPGANLASWKIFGHGSLLATDEQLMDMYQYASNTVAVQNHSWGFGGNSQLGPGPLATIGIFNAVHFGRDGKGSVIVRGAGTLRSSGADANDDAYTVDPQVITVGGVALSGRVANYSDTGSCILVSAPGGDSSATLFTTDRQGSLGYNTVSYTNDPTLSDYCFDISGFTGTSAATPLVAGVAALALSVNTNLTYRDVQQILLLSARHIDTADPGIVTNGAGLRVSHNQGFGIPDAGAAVQLARNWPNRLPAVTLTWSNTTSTTIPDDSLHVLVPGVAPISSSPDLGIQPDVPTAQLPLVDVGQALGPISQNLTNKGALIQRGFNNFSDKITYAAQAGAAFAIVYNNTGTTDRLSMGTTDFVPIPAIFIGKIDGDALHNMLLQSNVQAQIALASATYTFNVTNTLSCEHVMVRLQTDHPRRGDLRITLRSPAGTISVLDHVNSDPAAGPVDWTYMSTHHFYESSYGTWTIAVTDESNLAGSGSVSFCSLSIEGVPIADIDHDGLDDNWELAHFGSLAYGPQDDPDNDGYDNMREQIMGTDPLVSPTFLVDLSRWSSTLARVSWTSSPSNNYSVLAGADVTAMSPVTSFLGTFRETEWFVPYTNAMQFFQVHTP